MDIYQEEYRELLIKYSGLAMNGLLADDCNQSDIGAQAVSNAKDLIKQLQNEN